MSYDPPNSTNSFSSRNLSTNYTNGSGSTILKGTPVATLSTGLVTTIDASDQASVDAFVGLYAQDTPNGASGLVIDSGRLENVTTSFNVGDPLYISKTGGLINVPPSIGVNGFVVGDEVVFVGVVVINEFNPSLKDIKVLIEKVGDL
jgi:hypothetical protein